jgi:PAS domain S-box-containing protein
LATEPLLCRKGVNVGGKVTKYVQCRFFCVYYYLSCVMSISETELPAEPPAADEATTALAEAEARKRFLELVQGLDAIVWEMDAQTRKFTFVSDRAVEILGYPISHWLHEPNFLHDRLLHREDRDLVLAFWMAATNEAQQEFQYRAIAADNRVVWLKDSVRVIGDENGRTKLLRGVMVDITKEKQAEELNQQLLQERALRAQLEAEQEALRKSEQRYAQILDSLQDWCSAKFLAQSLCTPIRQPVTIME